MGQNTTAVIGSGFSSLTAATVLAKNGYKVTVFEKNDQPGGRARIFKANGYTFDMGPSWYWMPDVFESYYSIFGKTTKDFYDLKLLDPGFTIYFGKDDRMDIPASLDGIYALFEREEANGAEKLKQFLHEAEIKYKVAMSELVYMPSESITEFIRPSVIKNAPKLQLLSAFSKHAKKFFSNPRLLKLIEFPVIFLGATSNEIPAMYSLMNYAAFNLSTWYPMGGFSKITEAMVSIAKEHGVEFRLNEAVTGFTTENKSVKAIQTTKGTYNCNAVIGGADYAHVEDLLGENYRNYKANYWESKTFAPSSLIFYLGVNKKLPKLEHHTLFFDEELSLHSEEIYKNPQWPSKPLFYVCCSSKTDATVAPEGHENIFILMPLASGLEDNEALRQQYLNIILSRIENITGESIQNNIVYNRSFCIKDFVRDYNAYKGNAYGLASTLKQTAIFRPAIRNKKLKNFYYAGQLTLPGPGVPPAIISGQIAAGELMKKMIP